MTSSYRFLGLALLLAAMVLAAPDSGAVSAQNAPQARGSLENRLNLKQIASLYQTYNIEKNKPPPSVEAFLDYIGKDAANLAKLIKEEYVIVVPGVKPVQDNIIAYQNKELKGGKHLVALGDGSLVDMQPDELKEKLKKQK